MKRVLASAIFLLLCGSQCVLGQDAPFVPPIGVSLEDYCDANPCRKDVQVRFLTDQGIFDEQLDHYLPVVQGDRISLLPGETIYIEAEVQGGDFVNFNQVGENTNPDHTIVFDFQQREGKVDMQLKVDNPFAERMKFHLDMIDFDRNAHPTSSCPVVAGGSVFETWPHPIPELIVSGVRVLAESDGFRCEY